MSFMDEEVSREATLGEDELSSERGDCCGKQRDNKSSIVTDRELLSFIVEGEEATMKEDCKVVVAELCSTVSSPASQSTSDWDNNASMTETEDGNCGVNVAEDRTPTELVSIVERL